MPISISVDNPHAFLELCRVVAAGPDVPCAAPEDVGTWLKPGTLREEPTDLTHQVRAFFTQFEFTDRTEKGPTALQRLPQDEVHSRLVVLVREFREVLAEFGIGSAWVHPLNQAIARAMEEGALVKAELPKVAQELADLDFAAEGIRVMLGIPRVPVAMAVYQANMKKMKGEGWDPEKPPDWKSPFSQIVGALVVDGETKRV